MLGHETVNNFIDLAQLLLVWGACRCSDLDDIPQVSEQLLLDSFLEALVTGVIKGLPSTRQR